MRKRRYESTIDEVYFWCLDQSFRLIGMPGRKTADQIDAFEQRQIPGNCYSEQFKTISQVIDVQQSSDPNRRQPSRRANPTIFDILAKLGKSRT